MKAPYDRIGVNYDDTRQADPFLSQKLFDLLNPVEVGKYLEVGCGTGNYTMALHDAGLQIIGLDPSQEMLRKAMSKCDQIEFIQGVAEEIPLEDDALDGVIVFLSIHHWQDLKKGFSEIARVLKPKSRLVVFTSYPDQTKGYWLKEYFPQMIADSAKTLPARGRLLEALEQAGLNRCGEEFYEIHEELQDLFLYNGKHHPMRYLDPRVRKGISSFSQLALKAEVNAGLMKLESDINSGKIQEVIYKHESDRGDYVFLVADKD